MMWRIAVIGLVFLAGCQRCSEPVSESAKPEPTPTPQIAPVPSEPLPSRVIAEAFTGKHLGNGALLETQDKSPVLLSAVFRSRELLLLDVQGEVRALKIDGESLGGVYRLSPHRAAVLERGGNRIFFVDVSSGTPVLETKTVSVGKNPRVMAFDKENNTAWVLTNDPARKLVHVDLQTLQTQPVQAPGSTSADLVFGPHQKFIFVANLASYDLTPISVQERRASPRIPVESEPYRIRTAPEIRGGTLWVLHANSPRISVVSAAEQRALQTIALPFIPTHIATRGAGPFIAVLCSGAGKLILLHRKTWTVAHTLDVPVGSSDLLWLQVPKKGERIVVATGVHGELWNWDPADIGPKPQEVLSLGFAAGRLYPETNPGYLWVVGPQAGRAAQCLIALESQAQKTPKEL